ncbi:diguanylate phosphodiesterase [Ethanoligenens harbinense YUAN-3]|uniref:Diguanylate phosphodiesterase n=1 Tax=Ethanoligenens harbinense (strain DSM 18485 / JCM 12961 / CGMCC 1.5033 / YUAN-3) TaxID=663278 RepID=E6U6D6_ETHHY|nr:diguanylate phosphodiesterase [Ethanoligenens harbinense YUAN-3]
MAKRGTPVPTGAGVCPENVEALLRDALQNDRFTLAYQPQVDLQTGQLDGAEVLLRWLPPTGAPVLPPAFIPTAEATGLIHPIGEWVLRTACGQTHRWNANNRPFRLAVNLSPRQFSRAEEIVLAALRETGLDPGRLELEITEQSVAEDLPAAAGVLRRLNALGVRLALDDFGTGYSSLQYLARLPVHTLKIDRSFVAGMIRTAKARIIVENIIRLAHGLSMRVVAEGVETPGQRDLLRRQGCDLAQGFLYSRPLAGKKLRMLLTRPEPCVQTAG